MRRRFFQHLAQRVAACIHGFDEALRAGFGIGDDNGRAPRRALLVQGFEDFEVHDSPATNSVRSLPP